MEAGKFNSVKEYIGSFDAGIQALLKSVQQAVKEAVPDGEEVISYNMPTIKMGKVLVYYSANKAHIGFYPTAVPMTVFAEKLKGYKTSKGAVQFPYNEPLPLDLIKEITAFRLQQVQGTKSS